MPRSVQVLDRRRVRDAGVGAAQLLGDPRVGHRQALDVGLVDDRLVVRRLRRAVDAPVEVRVDDDGLRHVRRRVVVVALLGLEVVAEDRLVPVDLAVDGLGVRVEEQLVRVAAQALGGVVRAVHAEAVALAGVDAGQEGVPDVAVHLGEPDALLVAVVVEEAQLDLLGHLAEDREIRAGAVVRGPEGVGAAGPDLRHLSVVPSAWRPRGAGAGGPSRRLRDGSVHRWGGGGGCRVPPHSLPHTWRSCESGRSPSRRGRRRPPRRTAGGVVRRTGPGARSDRAPADRPRPGDPGWRWSLAGTAPATRHARAAPAGRTSSGTVPPLPGAPVGPGTASDPFCHTLVVPSSRAHDHRHPAHPGALPRRQRLRALRRPAGGDQGSSPSG